MFPPTQQPAPPREDRYKLPLIILASAGALFLLSLGLCGVGGVGGGSHSSFFVGAGLLALGLSGVALVVSMLWLLIAAITSRG